MQHNMSDSIYISCAEHFRTNYAETTLETLARARYNELITEDHDNFIAFIYECIKDDAKKYQRFAENEENEFLTIYDAIHILIENMFFSRDTKTIKDYICKPQLDEFSPYYHIPLLYDYDPNENYKRA